MYKRIGLKWSFLIIFIVLNTYTWCHEQEFEHDSDSDIFLETEFYDTLDYLADHQPVEIINRPNFPRWVKSFFASLIVHLIDWSNYCERSLNSLKQVFTKKKKL